MERGLWHAAIPAEDGFYWVYDRDEGQTFVADVVQREMYLLGDALTSGAGSSRFFIYSARLTPPLLPAILRRDSTLSVEEGGCV